VIWRLLLIAALAIGGVVVVLREVLIVGEGRRSGIDPKQLYRRFRRRTKGIGLLVLTFALTLFHMEIARGLGLIPSEHFMLLGLLLICVIWVMILAGRDLHETTLEALEQRQQIALEALMQVEVALHERKAAKPAAEKPPTTEG
jgi:hypothetical protein